MALPEGLEFLHAGWWVVHALAVFAYQFGYARGRGAARREQRARDLAARKG
jgi:hypothetical protein